MKVINNQRYLLCVAVFVFAAQAAFGERVVRTETAAGYRLSVVEVYKGLEHPWGMVFLPDGGILVTERPGRLQLISEGTASRVNGLPKIASTGQGGLLDVTLHPEFDDNRYVYLTYVTKIGRGTGTAVGRGRLNGSRLEGFEEIFSMKFGGTTSRHYGSRMVFAADGTLLFTIGDRGEMARAQDLGDHAGSTIRMNDDGSVPDDNPFVDNNRVLPEIYSYGHRNAQGMAVDSETGVIWQHEHGPKGGDEVNILSPGADFGWPKTTYGVNYNGSVISRLSEMEGVNGPEIYWDPSIAPSGMTVYRGDEFPEWNGDLFVGALVKQHLRRIDVAEGAIVGQEELLSGVLGRIRDVRTGPNGHLWILTDERRGGLYRIERAG